jgi:putative CocE/NonD family hydrolase
MRSVARTLVVSLLIGSGCRAAAEDAAAIPPVAPDDVVAHAPSPRGEASPPIASALAEWVRTHYDKREVMIPMRDGVRLFTAIYTPKAATRPVPIMLMRTPYSVGPYGEDAFPERLGPSETLARRGFAFAYQDVRGRFMSEGEFVDVRPHRAQKQGASDIDESTDTFDTIEWLLANVPGNSGRVGQWGISYPGFYAAAGMIDAHPALRAVSPQAPIADWWFDDFHHHGAFFLPHAFNFYATFGRARPKPTKEWGPRFDHGTPDGYAFFLDLGPLSNANERWFHGEIAFWNELVAHPDRDEFWQARDLLPHLRNVAPAVMTVGGLFDAEDLYGPLAIYRAIEAQDPDTSNVLVMGPWKHGGWARTPGDQLGKIGFGSETSRFYQEEIEAPFFVHHLDDGPAPDQPEAWVFETGRNRWRRFDAWPPPGAAPRTIWCAADGSLVDAAPSASRAFVQWTSDPDNPVPYTGEIATGMVATYMTEDQRFAARRPDVVTFQTPPLEAPLTIAGPLTANLWVSTSGTDSDFVVKLVDVFPDDAGTVKLPDGTEQAMGGYQMMVRSEVIRGRYRESPAAPRPFRPGQPTAVDVPLQAVLHTFEKGHRVMIQVQSTWFPLVDRNPHRYAKNVFLAKPSDFVKAEQRVYCDQRHPTRLELGVLPPS